MLCSVKFKIFNKLTILNICMCTPAYCNGLIATVFQKPWISPLASNTIPYQEEPGRQC